MASVNCGNTKCPLIKPNIPANPIHKMADSVAAKLAELQIHVPYLEGWLKNHKGAIQEHKMQTLYDIITGKMKYALTYDFDTTQPYNTFFCSAALDWTLLKNAVTFCTSCR